MGIFAPDTPAVPPPPPLPPAAHPPTVASGEVRTAGDRAKAKAGTFGGTNLTEPGVADQQPATAKATALGSTS